jgi:lysyl-tRNA synthetase class 2
MKRLLTAGYPRLFQICRCWREGERGRLHLPEFTILEWYCSGSNYQHLMEDCEALVQHVARRLDYRDTIAYQGREINLASPWPRMTVREAFSRYAQVSMAEALEGGQFDPVMVQDIEPQLPFDKPVFLYDYPSERGSLARLREDDPAVAERMELYIGGLELANGFSELADPVEQRARFLSEETRRRWMGKRPYYLPARFLEELADMPPSAGIALGVDRLVMLFADTATIDDVIAFSPEEL